MTWLAGAAVRAADRIAGQAFTFLGQPQTACFYRAFDEDLMGRDGLADVCREVVIGAAEDAGWLNQAESRECRQNKCLPDIPLFVGSTAYIMSASERSDFVPPDVYSLSELADALGSSAPVHSFATSCTSSANALMQAHRLLDAGFAERALVLGVESYNLFTLMHFHSLGLLGKEYRPFEQEGMILGEGAACLALSRTRPSEKSPVWRLAGIAANTDTAHPAESSRAALADVMRRALNDAGVAPAQITEIKAHGVGTAGSDRAEQAALAEVFGCEIPPLVCAKPQTGHTLGASAAVETALWAQGRLNSQIHQSGCRLANFFGFGGNQVAMVWEVGQ